MQKTVYLCRFLPYNPSRCTTAATPFSNCVANTSAGSLKAGAHCRFSKRLIDSFICSGANHEQLSPAKCRNHVSRPFRLPETFRQPRNGQAPEGGGRVKQTARSLRALALSCLLTMSATSYAQFQGYNSEEHHRQWNPQHQGYSRGGSYQGTVIHIPDQEWINYHGALASNGRGNTGKSEFARSKREAEQEALRNCGTPDCRITAYARNGCLAAAFDGKGSGVGAEATKEAAEAEAMKICQSDGSTCVINYSQCFHPVRIK